MTKYQQIVKSVARTPESRAPNNKWLHKPCLPKLLHKWMTWFPVKVHGVLVRSRCLCGESSTGTWSGRSGKLWQFTILIEISRKLRSLRVIVSPVSSLYSLCSVICLSRLLSNLESAQRFSIFSVFRVNHSYDISGQSAQICGLVAA
jgi:hypothetical protein